MEFGELDEFPSERECLERCQQFSQLTNTNNALAMMFLQQVSWDLEKAVENFYSSGNGVQEEISYPYAEFLSSGSQSQPPAFIDLTSDSDEVVVIDDGAEEVLDRQHAHLFRLLSWNIDGLSLPSRRFRTAAVVSLIRGEKFQAVCLQEVVRETLAYIQEELSSMYEIFHPSDFRTRDYFPIICILKHPGLSILANTFQVSRFSGSVMQRILLSLDVVIDPPRLLGANPRARQWKWTPLRVRLWTSHLESCGQFAEERKHQLRNVWAAMQASVDPNHNTPDAPLCGIFCGDLNIRDKEIKGLGGLPPGMVDVWEVCGARPEAKLTWDPRRNPNLQLDYPQPCSRQSQSATYGMRFDRFHVMGRGLRPVDFELRGLERVPGHSHFPSDHWAILGHFDLTSPPT